MKLLGILIFLSTVVIAQNNAIILDENFDDWENVNAFVDDPEDNIDSGVDFKKLWVTNDENYLFLRIDLFDEIIFQEDTSAVLYINTDNNTQTGSQEYNSGAEIKYYFGKRFGYFYHDNDSVEIFQNDIFLVSAPTVSSNVFELCIALDSKVNDNQIFTSDEITIKFANIVPNIDEIPNGNEFLGYAINSDQNASYPEYQISKDGNSLFRLLSYNVHKDDIFNEDKFDSYKRILQAIDPDIIAFQEIYDHTSEETVELVEQFLPSAPNQTWYHAKVQPADGQIYNRVDVLLLSRFPILETYRIRGLIVPQYGIDRPFSGHLIDLPDSDKDLFLIIMHTVCCQNNSFRETELQEVMSFVRDAKTTGGELDLEANTPIIITGDMNLVGPAYQQNILINGDLLDNSTYGEDFNPDWDETPFADAKPFSSGFPGVITWFKESETYAPGRLDYIIYSDYALNLENSYSLFTKTLLPEDLTTYGLTTEDAMIASDHLPVVADFSMRDAVGVNDETENLPSVAALFQNYPNPFSKGSGGNTNTIIKYSIAEKGYVQLKVYDVLGKEVATLVNEEQSIGDYKVEFNASNLTSGIYFYRLQSGDFVKTNKLLLLK